MPTPARSRPPRRSPGLLLLVFFVGLGLGTGRNLLAQGSAYPEHAPAASLACYERARDATDLTTTRALELCHGATSSAPLACYLRASRETDLSNDDAIGLCQCAASDAPVSCYAQGQQQTELEPKELLGRCSAMLTRGGEPPGCQP